MTRWQARYPTADEPARRYRQATLTGHGGIRRLPAERPRLDRVLPFRESRDEEDERHVHPLQLDVIDRAVVLWSNPGETVLTPFMGVGSEVYGAVRQERRGIGIELKPSYYRQAVANLATVDDTSLQMVMDEVAV